MTANGDGEHADIEVDLEDQAAAPRIARSPKEPTSLERTLHEVTHLPLRSWCRFCMMGRSKDAYHARLAEVDDVPRIGMDYMRVSEHGVNSTVEGAAGDVGITMLVVRDFMHKSVWVYPVEGKGVTMAEWLPGMIRADMSTCGMDNSMLIVKSDQEPAIKELQEEIARQRRQEGSVGTIFENSRIGDSSSNGRTERSIQEFRGMLRTLKFALEARTGDVKIGLDHPIIPWMAKHGAAQICRFQVRASGRTSYQNIKGYACRDPMCEFGESVLFHPPKTNKEKRQKNALAERALDGVWLGTDLKTSTNIIATDSGVYFAGRVIRKAPCDRWSRAAIDAIQGCPQEPVPGRGRDIPSFVRPELRGEDRAGAPPAVVPTIPDELEVRPMYVRKADVGAYGRTPAFKGCRDVILEKAHCTS